MRAAIATVVLSALFVSANALAERESEGPPGPRYELICQPETNDVSVRIMRFYPNYEVANIVIIHDSTMLLFSEPVTIQEGQLNGAPRIYHGEQADLIVQTASPPVFREGKQLLTALLKTRPYSGELALFCEVAK